ncbi:hypothetical protein Ancab_004836 [Ancistrocladus abbreviatus]
MHAWSLWASSLHLNFLSASDTNLLNSSFLSLSLSPTKRAKKMEVKLGPLSLSPSNSLRRRGDDSNSPEFEFWMVRNPSFPPPNLASADELFSGGVLLPLHLLHHHNYPDSVDDSPPDSLGLVGDQPSSDISITNSAPQRNCPSEPEPSLGQTTESSSSTIAAEYASSANSTSVLAASKRWKDMIFKKKLNENDVNNGEEREDHGKKKEKEKKKEKKHGSSSNLSSAELNINIWPFSRSKSAGNNSSRPRSTAAPTRKVSSAPCSRSNSAGESKSRKWPSSPARGGVHVGRTSPVWQVHRVGSIGRGSEGSVKNVEKSFKKHVSSARRNKSADGGDGGSGSSKVRVLNLNVPMCIGYGNNVSCRKDETSAIGAGLRGIDTADDGGQRSCGGGGDRGQRSGGNTRHVASSGGGNMFNLRSLFTKKVY